MTKDYILFEVKGRTAVITINRADKANAFNIEMLKKMHEMLIKADINDKVKCIIIKSSEEKYFSSGYDLNEIQTTPENAIKMIEWGRKVNETILFMKKLIITQVQGIAIGFGVMVILASDLRIFADKPKEELYLRFPELSHSIFPQTGGLLLPLLAFGLSYTKNILFSTDKIGLQELKNLNFPTRIFSVKTLDTETFSFAKKISKYKRELIYLTKSGLMIMNKVLINSCFNLEEELGKITYERKKTGKELDTFIKDLYERYQ